MKKWMIAVASAMLACGPMALAQTDKPAPKDQKAQVKKLAVGDKAPAIKVEKFIKGEPVKEFEKGKVYVVEFWATWCRPCIAAFPHLSELQKEYKDKGVTFIGTNIWERGYSESTIATVADFVKNQGDKMAYTVAYDGGTKFMEENWMNAAGIRGIPAAFVVNKEGKIAWIGNPHDKDFDSVIAKVAAGSLDAIETIDPRALNSEIMGAIKAKDFAKVTEIGNRVLNGPGKDNPEALNVVAWTTVDPASGLDKKDMDLDLAMKAAERANELTKGKSGEILDTLARVYFIKGDIAKAIELQTKAVELAPSEKLKEELSKVLDEYKNAKR
jgi:thiol-disulfide isomerase/thioredoxin